MVHTYIGNGVKRLALTCTGTVGKIMNRIGPEPLDLRVLASYNNSDSNLRPDEMKARRASLRPNLVFILSIHIIFIFILLEGSFFHFQK